MPLSISIDRRVELMSTIFLLAGSPGYNQAEDDYTSSVREYFQPFEGHKVVKLAQNLYRSRGICYDAPMSLAIHINSIDDLTPRIDFGKRPNTLDKRWSDLDITAQFLQASNEFFADTRFNEFHRRNQSRYDSVLKVVQAALPEEFQQFKWLDEFYGKNMQGSFHLVIAMLTGTNSFGPRIIADGKEERYCIIGRSMADPTRSPKFSDNLAHMMIHEFGHSYANPQVDLYLSQLEASGKRIFLFVEDEMRKQAYGLWPTVFHESLVRAVVIRYHMTHSEERIVRLVIENERARHFYWIEDFANLLGEYERQREVYPTLDRLKANLTFGVADFRTLEIQVEGIFDAVISCDNSLHFFPGLLHFLMITHIP